MAGARDGLTLFLKGTPPSLTCVFVEPMSYQDFTISGSLYTVLIQIICTISGGWAATWQWQRAAVRTIVSTSSKALLHGPAPETKAHAHAACSAAGR